MLMWMICIISLKYTHVHVINHGSNVKVLNPIGYCSSIPELNKFHFGFWEENFRNYFEFSGINFFAMTKYLMDFFYYNYLFFFSLWKRSLAFHMYRTNLLSVYIWCYSVFILHSVVSILAKTYEDYKAEIVHLFVRISWVYAVFTL